MIINKNNFMNALITGNAGFIGYHLTKRLICEGHKIIGFDNMNNFYDKNLKFKRLFDLQRLNLADQNFTFIKGDLEDMKILEKIFKDFKPDFVIHLAAQAGVRYSITNPLAYINSNLAGFGNILECCRNNEIKHLIYASSSSVYGGNKKIPFKEEHSVDHPVSLYAATKKSNELMAHCYSHLYNIPTTGLRFFTVYGPWGRPDMAPFLFTKSIIEKKPIQIFNNGDMLRDFTYIDDIIESLIRVINKIPQKKENFNNKDLNSSLSWAPYRIFNIGSSNPTPLMEFIDCLENSLKIKAKKVFLPMQPGDVKITSSDTSLLENWIDFKPNTPLKIGIENFVNWYKKYNNIK